MELQFAFSPVGFPRNKHLPVLPRPLPLGEVAPQVPERVRILTKDRHTAISISL